MVWMSPFFASSYVVVYVVVSVDSDSNTLLDKLLFKLFWDRGQIWSVALDGIISNTGLLPPIKAWQLTYTSIGNNDFENEYQVDFEYHNFILGLIRYNIYIFGGILIYLFLTTMKQLYNAKAYLVGRQRVLAVSMIGLGIAVFITGQYNILQLNTSFLFMSVVGELIAYNNSLQTLMSYEQ